MVVRNNDRALGTTPAALLAGKEEVEEAFNWKSLPAADGLEWLGATPKDKDSAFSELRLGFDTKGLAALEVIDNFGQHTSIRLMNLERNPKLTPDEIRKILAASAKRLGPNNEFGAGLVDPAKALQLAAPKTAAAPSAR